uniref:Methyltransferase type 11 domain-containing protein n=1 Tax=Fibrocapsa japonica TaxID=94617 RepID=A0A7S2Y1H1_9STRA
MVSKANNRRTFRGHGSILLAIITFTLGFLFGRNFSLLQSSADCKHVPERALEPTIAERALEPAIAVSQPVEWQTPEEILNERHKECEGRKISSTGGFCLTKKKNIGGNQMKDEKLADFLGNNVFSGYTVMDLGAGLGHYGVLFRENPNVKSWVGYDGAMNVQEQTKGLVRFMDLTQPHASDERPCVGADWVLSLEVAEHIPVVHTDAYLRNIRCRARVGAVISWGRPEQKGGLGHVNTRTESDAIAAVERWGFKVDWELTNAARATATLPHFKKTVVVYHVIKDSLNDPSV